LAFFGPSFGWLTDTQRRFPDVFRLVQKWFHPAEFCFAPVPDETNAALPQKDVPVPQLVQWPTKI